MISVQEALDILAQNTVDFGEEELALEHSMRRVIKEPVHSDRPLPPYDRVTMDGIAINYAAYEAGQRSFPIDGVAAAGMPRIELENADHCLEVMTGAIMPLGADTVIPYEEVDLQEKTAGVHAELVKRHQNIHFEGIDRQPGKQIIPEQQIISAAEIGVGASTGKARVKVARLPRTMVISTGDELVEIDQQPEQHQIRRSNVYRLLSTLRHSGIPADSDHLPDDKPAIIERLRHYIQKYDVIMLSGGVSKGKFDFLPEALETVGVKKLFHRIRQKPGKPFWFGQTDAQCTVFGFPGNPVSSFLCYHRYFKTWLDLSIRGKTAPTPYARLAEDVTFKPDLTYFLEVSLSYTPQAEILAHPRRGSGSGDLANLADADAFIQLPRGKDLFRAGEVYPVYIYRDL